MSIISKLVRVSMFLLLLASCSEAAKQNQVILTNKNSVVLADEVNAETVAKVLQEVRKLDADLKKGEPLYLILNTPGGSISDGLELIDVIKGMDRKVHTITVFAASMGFQIAQNLNDRLITESGILMSHRASTSGTGGEFGGQEPSQLSNRMGLWSRRIKSMDEQTVKRTNGKQTLESYTKAYENELWLLSQDSVSEGYADKVVNVKCDKSLNGTRDQDFFFFGVKIVVTFSKCPVVTGPLEIKALIKTQEGFVPLNTFIEKGGMFGTACTVQQSQSKYNCPSDVSLSLEKVEEMKRQTVQKFSQEYMRNNIKRY